MIFIGYSSGDRYTVVESLVFHLKNYGFEVWYDFYDMFLGDNRYEENFKKGISGSHYVIFVISKNFFSSNCAKEELDYAQLLYEKGKIILFPLLYRMSADELPQDYNWIKKIIYNEIGEHSGTLFVANQIIERMLHDEVLNRKYRSLSECVNYLRNSNKDYMYSLLDAYLHIDTPNYSARIALLYSAYLYIKSKHLLKESSYACKIVQRIYVFTGLNVALDHLSLSIFSLAMILILNDSIEHL